MEHTPKEEEIREEFRNKYFCGSYKFTEEIADYWLKIRREAIAEERKKIVKKLENIITHKEIVNGFQPRGYTTEKQESEIFFDGYGDGRHMIKMDIMRLISHLTQE